MRQLIFGDQTRKYKLLFCLFRAAFYTLKLYVILNKEAPFQKMEIVALKNNYLAFKNAL